MTLGEKIRELRNKEDFSLRELAEKIGISAPFLSDIELGKRFPSEEVLAILAKTLGTKVMDLREFDQRPPTEEIRNRISRDPAFGILLRKIVDDVPTKKLQNFLNSKKNG